MRSPRDQRLTLIGALFLVVLLPVLTVLLVLFLVLRQRLLDVVLRIAGDISCSLTGTWVSEYGGDCDTSKHRRSWQL